MKKHNPDSPYREQKRRRRLISLALLAGALFFVITDSRLPPFLYPVRTIERTVLDRVDLDEFDVISLSVGYTSLELLAEGADITPILKYVGTCSVRTAWGQRIPIRIDRSQFVRLQLYDQDDPVYNDLIMDIYSNQYIQLSWKPNGLNRSITNYYKIMDGTLDYNTLAALFPPMSETE